MGPKDDWMAQAILQTEDGSRVIGEYDGYGRINHSSEVMDFDKPEVWHLACWKAAGRPEYSGPSESARDQGLHDYTVCVPRHVQDVEALREIKQTEDRKQREEIRRVWTIEVEKLKAESKEVPDYALRLAETGGD